jgi:hypothetical protein
MRIPACGLFTPVCLFSVIAACGDSVATSGDASTSSDDTSTTAVASTGGETPTTSGDDTTGDTTSDTNAATTDTPVPREIARGVRLTRVTATQGVQTELVRDGVELTADEYTVPLISRRKTVLRADWSLHAEFTPRELIGRLTVWTPEGERRIDEFTVMVDGPSNDGDLLKTFAWQLPPDLVRPGMEYRIEAFEADPELATGEVSDPPPVLPLAGRGTLVVEDQPMVIKNVLIPIKHVFDGQTCMPEITDVDVDIMKKWMEQHNPVERADVTVGEPMEYTKTIGAEEEGFVPILAALSDRREADAPADNVYYYGLITSCDSYPPGLLGQAIGIPDEPTPGNAFERLSVGRYLGGGAAARDTYVHEVGHSQGRYHIRCSGGEAGTDPDYPHTNGAIGVWGYGIHDTQLRSPTGYRDYMSYCSTSFVSDFGWDLTYDVIKELSSWDMAAPPRAPDDGPLLLGAIYPDGHSQWWTARGTVPKRGRSPDLVVEFATDADPIVAPASLAAIPDSDAELVVVAAPKQWSAVSDVRLKVAGKTRATAPRSAVRGADRLAR